MSVHVQVKTSVEVKDVGNNSGYCSHIRDSNSQVASLSVLWDHITLTDSNVLHLNTSLELYRYTQHTGLKGKVLLVG